ncbi:hypothetical protein HYPSUDRAFT_203259 [Hypholoma sublateritium FD-334 SS-4]|uniref:Uncharacterized protein n=1 Tax=Hypholoma sublateritium (strain FD-334 SS-4) TaxID=945553 RepID=A0A0D2PMG9_HYPSF|nr:hypothetical protein HYPSUDRAFT_203259 [Hypholoma sublateritium FD-334 SS-4]
MKPSSSPLRSVTQQTYTRLLQIKPTLAWCGYAADYLRARAHTRRRSTGDFAYPDSNVSAHGTNALRISRCTRCIDIEGIARGEDAGSTLWSASVQYRDVGVGTTEEDDATSLAQPTPAADDSKAPQRWSLSRIFSFLGSRTGRKRRVPRTREVHTTSGLIQITTLPSFSEPSSTFPLGFEPVVVDFGPYENAYLMYGSNPLAALQSGQFTANEREHNSATEEAQIQVIVLEGYEDPVEVDEDPVYEILESRQLTAHELNQIRASWLSPSSRAQISPNQMLKVLSALDLLRLKRNLFLAFSGQ